MEVSGSQALRPFRNLLIVAVVTCAFILLFPATSSAQGMLSSETWVGEFSGQGFEVDDNGPITAEILGRSIGEDQWGLGDPLYLDATLTELGNTVDDGIDSNYYNVEVNLYYLRDVSLPGGYDFDTEGKLWIGSIFHGCVIATVLFETQLWWVLKTGSCGLPGLNWYEGQCPFSVLSASQRLCPGWWSETSVHINKDRTVLSPRALRSGGRQSNVFSYLREVETNGRQGSASQSEQAPSASVFIQEAALRSLVRVGNKGAA